MLTVVGLGGNLLCELEDNQSSGCSKVSYSKTKGETASLSFDLPFYNSKTVYIKNGNYIIYKEQVYEIQGVSKKITPNGGLVLNISCLHCSDFLTNKYIVEQSLDPDTARTQLNTVLADTQWVVGTVQTEDILRGFEFSRETVFEALTTIAETFNGYIDYSVTLVNGIFNYVVNLYDRTNDEIFDVYSVNRNMTDVSINDNFKDFITRMYCFGGTDPLTGLDVDIINATVNGSLYGLNYVEDYSYYLDQGISAEYINANPSQFLKEDIWQDTNYVDPQTLYEDSIKRIAQLSQPSIEVSLTKLLMEDKIPVVGYPVYLIDEDNNSKTYKCFITGISTNEDEPQIYNLTISNVTIVKDLWKKISQATNTVGSVITNGNQISGSNVVDNTINTDQLANGAVTDAKVGNLSATKITTGTLDASLITVINMIVQTLSNSSTADFKLTVGDVIKDGITTKGILGYYTPYSSSTPMFSVSCTGGSSSVHYVIIGTPFGDLSFYENPSNGTHIAQFSAGGSSLTKFSIYNIGSSSQQIELQTGQNIVGANQSEVYLKKDGILRFSTNGDKSKILCGGNVNSFAEITPTQFEVVINGVQKVAYS